MSCGCRERWTCESHCAVCHTDPDDPVRYLWDDNDLAWRAEHPTRVCLWHQTILAEDTSAYWGGCP